MLSRIGLEAAIRYLNGESNMLATTRPWRPKEGHQEKINLPESREPVATGIDASSAVFEVAGAERCSGLPPNIGGNGGRDTDKRTIGGKEGTQARRIGVGKTHTRRPPGFRREKGGSEGA